MCKVFFTADQHFDHKNIIIYCNRPFSNINEMNQVLVEKWNKKVPKDGVVYCLGDFSFRSHAKFASMLHGKIILILGNHDKTKISYLQQISNIIDVRDQMYISICGQDITLNHYAMRTWNKSHFNAWHLYAHSHGKLPGQGKSFDVGVDAHNFEPWSWVEIVAEMDKRPNNMNYIGKVGEPG